MELRALYERYAPKVYGRCLYILKNEEEARDAMHDVFIKANKSMAEFRGDASPLTWLSRIATNHCLNVIRAKKAKWHDRYRREVENGEHAFAGPANQRETAELVRACLDKVDRAHAEVAVYYFVDGMTQKEITDLVGISTPTLRKRLRAFVDEARTELKRLMPDVEFKAPPI
jgi:RNA polymerase sigma factor (sigma-70 family)